MSHETEGPKKIIIPVDEQGGEEQKMKVASFRMIPMLVMARFVDENGVLGPPKIIARPIGSSSYYVIAQDASAVSDPKLSAAMDEFFKRTSMGRMSPTPPCGDVTAYTGAVVPPEQIAELDKY